jgi:hypothetical protein
MLMFLAAKNAPPPGPPPSLVGGEFGWGGVVSNITPCVANATTVRQGIHHTAYVSTASFHPYNSNVEGGPDFHSESPTLLLFVQTRKDKRQPASQQPSVWRVHSRRGEGEGPGVGLWEWKWKWKWRKWERDGWRKGRKRLGRCFLSLV